MVPFPVDTVPFAMNQVSINQMSTDFIPKESESTQIGCMLEKQKNKKSSGVATTAEKFEKQTEMTDACLGSRTVPPALFTSSTCSQGMIR